ncbi:MAG: DnaJ family domain-containing protein [Chloroflexota bacterium]
MSDELTDDEKKNISEEKEKELNERIEHQFRMRFDWDNLIEDKIQEGKEKGFFEELKGKGKPLNLNKNPFSKDKELAHGLLKDNKMTPAWIGSRKMIIDNIEALRSRIKKAWSRHEREYRILKDQTHRDSLIISWDDACLQWEKTISELNELINDYNLKRPINNLEIIKLDLNREFKKIGAVRWLRALD